MCPLFPRPPRRQPSILPGWRSSLVLTRRRRARKRGNGWDGARHSLGSSPTWRAAVAISRFESLRLHVRESAGWLTMGRCVSTKAATGSTCHGRRGGRVPLSEKGYGLCRLGERSEDDRLPVHFCIRAEARRENDCPGRFGIHPEELDDGFGNFGSVECGLHLDGKRPPVGEEDEVHLISGFR